MSGRPAIVVVDNHREVREVLAGVLEAMSYDTYLAGGYTEALEQIAQPGVRAVVSDVEMEPETGFDLLKTFREKHPDVAVILVSSYANDEMYKRATLAGAAEPLEPIEFKPKPWPEGTMLQSVDG